MIKKILKNIFKVFSYSLFFAIYGKVKKSISANDDDRVKIKKIEIEKNLIYQVYSIDCGRLYTDRIQDTAALVNKSIIEEASFQLRYTKDSRIYNGKINENVVFRKGTPRMLKKLDGTVLSLLTGGGGNNNYWHWLVDVLPRIGLCSKTFNLREVDYFLLPDNIKKFQKETLDLLNIEKNKRLSSKKYRHIKTKNLIVTDHPVVVSGDATKDTHNIPAWIIYWLRETFLNKNKTNKDKNKTKIYIDRGESINDYQTKRLISNEEEVKNYLLKNNFTIVKLHEIDFSKQVDIFNNVDCVVGLHGAGLTNLVFCRPKTKVIEFRNKNAGPMYENLSKKNNLNYFSIICESRQIQKFNHPNQQGSIEISIQTLDKILKG